MLQTKVALRPQTNHPVRQLETTKPLVPWSWAPALPTDVLTITFFFGNGATGVFGLSRGSARSELFV